MPLFNIIAWSHRGHMNSLIDQVMGIASLNVIDLTIDNSSISFTRVL